LSPAEDYGHKTQVRNVQQDAAPAAGWSVDWTIDDRWKLLKPGRDLHFRYTDLTAKAQALLAESWISTTVYESTDAAWVPTVIVRRQAETAPLASTFAGVLEPYEKTSNLREIRRLPLATEDGKTYGDANVAVEIRLADGRRDVLAAADTENPLGTAPAWSDGRVLVEKTSGLRLDGQLCFLRFDAEGKLRRVMLGRGNALSVGDVHIQLKNRPQCVEIAFGAEGASVVYGNAADVEIKK
jgi:hypothetical protein